VLAEMYVEVVTVLIRQQNHFRITRALRPMFFIDNHLMKRVRRYVVCVQEGTTGIIIVILLCILPL
jgi:two pore calcium channel protein 1